VPDPAVNNGFQRYLIDNQLWYGLPRGTLLSPNLNTGANPFSIGTDTIALMLQDPTVAQPNFINAVGNGANGWRNLTYGSLAAAYYQGLALQPAFSYINADNPDLSGVQKAGAKILHYHGMADPLVPVQSSMNYYTRVADRDGGYGNTQKYNRMYLVPGMGHCGGVGTAQGTAGPAVTTANLPQPAGGQLFSLLRAWVEGGAASAPTSIVVTSPDASASQRLCPYPAKATYVGTGAINSAANYTCR
jgi:feruloyl esterase